MTEAKRKPGETEAEGTGDIDALGRSHLSTLLGFRLRRAEIAMHRDFIRSLKPTDLTQKHLAVLLLILENPGISQIQLCAHLGTDPNTMTAFIDRLSERGLIFRVRSRVDRRKTELNASASGEALMSQALTLVDQHERHFRSRFNPAELEQLMGYLDRISADEPVAPQGSA